MECYNFRFQLEIRCSCNSGRLLQWSRYIKLNQKAQEHLHSWAFPLFPDCLCDGIGYFVRPPIRAFSPMPPHRLQLSVNTPAAQETLSARLVPPDRFFSSLDLSPKTEMRKKRKKLRIKWQKGIDKEKKIVYNK